ncbi:hypothetical protein [Paracoccus spongiarum]|uniref:DUF2946 domain-containing protein n=1 Tax=Paracoccus spongiarum TaxID=3064387 RepID=A0ABT9J6R9_9RHOB|nr:hypothetical protein [Paracoccus sp. 2205BS29-5]MDP5305502.1 hypothetical protein [Paracoccus sp. 2205BS29-5]
MRLYALRLLIVLGVVLGVVLPKTSAALAVLGLTDSRSVLICTGDGLERLDLGPGHHPQPAPEQAHDGPLCLLVAALDGVPPVWHPGWLALAHAAFLTRDSATDDVRRLARTRFARAPPRA